MVNFKLASFAIDEEKSQGRFYPEVRDDSTYRSVFGRDRDRIVNSSAFRRLQYKTQVFVNHEGDHYRTRLTHSIEVAQIARWIAGALEVNKDLAEIVSLAHDLGHTPFGHAGEDALNAKVEEYGSHFGGFSHNAHTLRIITKLESRFIECEGLNLSWEMLEGVVKHNGPIISKEELHPYIEYYNHKYDLDLARFPSLESQISAISDDIAYNNHDIEDGLRADLFKVEDLFNIPLIGDIYQNIMANYPNIKRELLVGEAKKRFTLAMVMDVIHNTKKNIFENKINSVEDVRNAGKLLVNFSDEMELAHQGMKSFLMKNMYRHPIVNAMTENAIKVISGLFDFYMKNPNALPDASFDKYGDVDPSALDQKSLISLVSDYIAGMTDRYAIKEYEDKIRK